MAEPDEERIAAKKILARYTTMLEVIIPTLHPLFTVASVRPFLFAASRNGGPWRRCALLPAARPHPVAPGATLHLSFTICLMRC